MGVEILWPILGIVAAFLFIVVIGYHIFVNAVKPSSAGFLVRVLFIIWVVVSYLILLFVPLMRIIDTIGDTPFVILTVVVAVLIMIAIVTFFTRRRSG